MACLDNVAPPAFCGLAASGTTNTPASALNWADRVVSEARKSLGSIRSTAHVWPYTHGGDEFLGCSIRGDREGFPGYALTFIVGRDVDLTLTCEPHVPTMADALHMLGIVLAALDARMTLGRRGMEVNEDVLYEPLEKGRTNGPMRPAGMHRRMLRCPETT